MKYINNQKTYFPNLNGLRFIAAFLVMIHHIEQIKMFYGIQNLWGKSAFVEVIGKLGVVLFFVLSGFLITYLLLVEEGNFGKINIKNFYIRRILRIWPLYFIIIFLALFILPKFTFFDWPNFDKTLINESFGNKVLLYLFFSPNIVASIYGTIPYCSHTWSIGVEEQFYLIWPLFLIVFKKNRISLMLFIIALYMIMYQILEYNISDRTINIVEIRCFWKSFNIDCMSIGGLFAILLFKKSKYLKIILNNYVFYISLVLVIIFIANGVHLKNYQYEFYALFFAIIIINLAVNKTIFFSLENKYFNYLGNISYGIYMYHILGIVIAIKIVTHFNSSNDWILYPLSLFFAICFASLSYKYFETYFLKLKNKNLH